MKMDNIKDNSNHNFDCESPTTVLLKESKQTMYIAGDPMSPKLHLRGSVHNISPHEKHDREVQYRSTQPSFHINVEKTDQINSNKMPKTRVETPKLEPSSKQKVRSDQKDLLKEIANTQERRPNQIFIVQARRLRNTANSFASEQSPSSRHDSIHNINAISAKKGNDDLIDVTIKKDKDRQKGLRDGKQSSSTKKTNSRIQRHQPIQPNPIPFTLTNLTQAYTQGVTKLLETLPFQQQQNQKLKPIVSASLDLKKIGGGSPLAVAQAQEMIGQQIRRSNNDSMRNLANNSKDLQPPQVGLLRKPVKVPPPAPGGAPSRCNEESHQNSGQIHSQRSLSNGYPLQAIRSSIFRVEQAQDYTDLKLDFASQNTLMTDYQSQNFLESINNMQSNAEIGALAKNKKVTIRQKFPDPKDTVAIQSTPGMQVPKIAAIPPTTKAKQQQNYRLKKKFQVPQHHDSKLVNDTSTERHIMGILDNTDYHRLREHKDPSTNDGTSQQCTCYNLNQVQAIPKRLSHSIDCQQNNVRASFTMQQNHNTYRLSTSPGDISQSTQISGGRVTLKKNKNISARQPPRNVLQIQLRPLKGKAAQLKEYRTMIEQEYGKEKKKQIYETMYQEVHGRDPFQHQMYFQSQFADLFPSHQNQYIKLNLRQELKPSPYVPKRNQHVKLKTISPRGDVQEKLVMLNDQNAEKMNTTINSFANAAQSTLRHSASRWNPNQQLTQKQFFLFSPAGTISVASPNGRYQQVPSILQDHQTNTIDYSSHSPSMKPENSIVNLEIPTSAQKQNNQQHQNHQMSTLQQYQPQQSAQQTQGNQINLGYVGMLEQQLQQNQQQQTSSQQDAQHQQQDQQHHATGGTFGGGHGGSSDYFNYLMQYNNKQANHNSTSSVGNKHDESVITNETSGHQNLPFGRIYSRMSSNLNHKNNKQPKKKQSSVDQASSNRSRLSRKTPNLAGAADHSQKSSSNAAAAQQQATNNKNDEQPRRNSVTLKHQSKNSSQQNSNRNHLMQNSKINTQQQSNAVQRLSIKEQIKVPTARFEKPSQQDEQNNKRQGRGGDSTETHSIETNEMSPNRKANNSSLMKVMKSPSPMLATQKRNNYERQLEAERKMLEDHLREQQLQQRDQEFMQQRQQEITTADLKDDECFRIADHVESLTNIHANEEGIAQSTASENENPMDQYDSQELLALQTDPRLELFSNPTEVEIVQIQQHPTHHTVNQQQSDWEYRKQKQALFAAAKRLESQKADETMGPLQKKPLPVQSKIKHQQVSSITQISQFYNESPAALIQQDRQLIKQKAKLMVNSSGQDIKVIKSQIDQAGIKVIQRKPIQDNQ